MTSRYYCGNMPLAPGADVQLSVEESRHLLKVMRARIGDEVIVFGEGGQYAAVVSGTGDKGSAATLRVVEAVAGAHPPSVRMTFLIPWIKGGKTDFVVQKLTELGVFAITIFQAEREVARGDESKLERLRKVALEACKQCERIDVPRIQFAPSLSAAVHLASDIPLGNRFLLHERENEKRLSSVVAPAIEQFSSRGILIASGPEGGWHPQELMSIKEQMTYVSLGPRILRAETAPLVAAAAVLALAGDI